MTAICVVGEMRTYNASALLHTLKDLDPVRVDYYLVEKVACVNSQWAYSKSELCRRYRLLVEQPVHPWHNSSTVHFEKFSTCDSPLLRNATCCGASARPAGYLQYFRSQHCIQQAFQWPNVSRVIRLRPDVVYDASTFKNANFGCNRKGRSGVYARSASDLLLVVTRQHNPLPLALHQMEAACTANKKTSHIPETLLKCPLLDVGARIVRPV